MTASALPTAVLLHGAFLAQRIKATAVSLGGASHCAMVARPQLVAKLVMQALETTAAR